MQLLVSVRSADEVAAALAGGADIIDAKEPGRGSLGPVEPDALNRILQELPGDCGASVALGDVTQPEQVVDALNRLELPPRGTPTYLKLGFAGVGSPQRVGQLLETAVSIAKEMASSPRVVAVAYADFERAGTISAALILSLAEAAGAAGVLLDTHGKDGEGLLAWLSPADLADWVAIGRRAELLIALAGSLRAYDLPLVCQADPAVVGIRGAACDGGRLGRISADRVRRFRQALELAVRDICGTPLSGTWRNA